MAWINHLLAHLRELNGLFLAVIAFGIASCASSLRAIKLEVECMHQDFDFVHKAHDGQHSENTAEMDNQIAAHMERRQPKDQN